MYERHRTYPEKYFLIDVNVTKDIVDFGSTMRDEELSYQRVATRKKNLVL